MNDFKDNYDGTAGTATPEENSGDAVINFGGGTIKVGTGMELDSTGHLKFFGGKFNVIGDDTHLDLRDNRIEKLNTENFVTISELELAIDIDVANKTADIIDNVNNLDIDISDVNVYNFNSISEISTILGNPIKFASGTNLGKLSLGFIDKEIEVNDSMQLYKIKFDTNGASLTSNGELTLALAKGYSLTPYAYENKVLQTTVAVGAYASNIENITKRVLNNTRKHELGNSIWLDTYATNEKIEYPTKFEKKDFDNYMYITTVGKDFDYDLMKSIEEKGSVFFGYLNSTQKYSNIEFEQENFYLGVASEFSKDNKYMDIGLILGKGKVDEISDNYDINSLSLGVKFGVEYKLTENIFIEPSLGFGYNIIDSDDHTNKDNVSISADTVNIFNVSPEIKLSMDTEIVKPYVAISYNYNGYNGGEIVGTKGIDRVTLPSVEVENYLEGRIGASKNFLGDDLKVYGEILGTTGEKDSFGVQVGIEYKF